MTNGKPARMAPTASNAPRAMARQQHRTSRARGAKRMRSLPYRSGATTEVRSIMKGKTCVSCHQAHIFVEHKKEARQASDNNFGRGILELPADASALTALETRHRMPRVCTTGCPENQRSCARRFAKHADAPQARLPRLRIESSEAPLQFVCSASANAEPLNQVA